MSVLERFARTNYSTRSRRERLQLLSPTIRHLSFDGASLPFTRRSPSPRTQSSDSLLSDDSSDLGWDKSTLLSLSDSVRASIRFDRSLLEKGTNRHTLTNLRITSEQDTERLSSFLEAVLKDEERRQPSMDVDTIEHTHLDKLLDEIIQLSEMLKSWNPSTHLPLRFRVNVAHCNKLRAIWRQRFREKYFMIDHLRCGILKGGPLKDVAFDSNLTYDPAKWETKLSDPMSELEGNLQFEAGHWWIHITCAAKDGIVACPRERPTIGRYGVTSLPLLSGREELIRGNGLNIVKYIRKGRASDMHIRLISQVGQKIRILRGYKLKSIYAPQAGVRYDGLYIIKQYGTKLDMVTNTYTLGLTLERVKDQKPMEVLDKVPTPSQADDWKLYEKLKGDHIKRVEGGARYLDWSVQREDERHDREDWVQDRKFRASVS
ncbi:PUA-like domain-containing protein [Xylariales sp. AK1849]|nr:PUA-like domain-containing protein [Xylariales sp. AK1849]